MKIIFVSNIYKEEEKKEVKRICGEIKKLGFEDYEIFVHDGIKNNRGFAYGINRGIEKGLKKGGEVFVVFNTDISLNRLNKKLITNGLTKFDILGFACKQDNTTYYGGQIDKWRMSGGLIKNKPDIQYFSTDFVSGSLMFIKKEVIEKTGLMDESYFFYYDEVDFCYRAKKRGFKIGIDSKNTYTHFEFSKINPAKDYFLAKNRVKFLLRYGNSQQKFYEVLRSPKTIIEYFPLIKSIISKSSFLTDFFSLNISSILNKLLHFGLFIFLVRNLDPSEYGIYTLVWAYIAIFNPFVDLGTTNYGLIYLPKEKKAGLNRLISMRFFVAFIIYILTNVFAWLTFKTQPLVALFVLLTSTTTLSNVWSGTYLILNSIRQKVYYSSIVSLFFNLFFVVIIIVFYLSKRNLFSIFLAIFLSYLVYLIANFYLVKHEVGKISLSIELGAWFDIFKKSYIYVLLSFFSGLYFKLDLFLLNFLKSETEVGIYSSGYKFLDALVLISGSYNIVVMPIISRLAKDKNALKKKLKKDIILLISIALPVVFLFYFFAPIFLPLILQGRYVTGIQVARIVIFSLPFIFLSSIFNNVLYAWKTPQYVLYIYIFQAILNLTLNLVFIPLFSIWAAAYITVLCELINAGITSYLVIRKFKNENFG